METTTQPQATEPISSTATPAQPATPETKPDTTPSTPADNSVPENWEYNGDRKAVPKPFENYVKGLDRYVTKKDQALAEAKKKAEEYDKLVNSDAYKGYQQSLARTQPNPTGIPTDDVTQEELDAIMAGDGKTLREVIRREAKRTLENDYKSEIERVKSVELKQKELETAEMIKSFSELHPTFNQYLEDDAYYEFMLASIQRGKSLDDVHAAIERLETRASAKAEASYKEMIEKKKAGSVVAKSTTGTPDVVYADDENHAKRLAVELALKNDPRQVHIRPKK